MASEGPKPKESSTALFRQKRPIRHAPKAVAPSRELSHIAFPYLDMENAISVARAMIENGGVACTRDQLAGAMKQTPSSGNFVMKIAAARLFGFVEVNQGKYQLTQIGFAVVDVDEKRQKAAKAEAFLNVPLYRRVYEEFKGKQLPPRPLGLEQAFVNFGVPVKQKDKARWVFEKSARQANFFTATEDRLVEPIIGVSFPDLPISTAEAKKPIDSPAKNSATAALDPLIEGLLRRLPDVGTEWEAQKRLQWLRTLAANLDVVYPPKEDDKFISIELSSL